MLSFIFLSLTNKIFLKRVRLKIPQMVSNYFCHIRHTVLNSDFVGSILKSGVIKWASCLVLHDGCQILCDLTGAVLMLDNGCRILFNIIGVVSCFTGWVPGLVRHDGCSVRVHYMVQDPLEVGVAPAIFPCIFIPPLIVEPLLLKARIH